MNRWILDRVLRVYGKVQRVLLWYCVMDRWESCKWHVAEL
jgi:hypothetical protein